MKNCCSSILNSFKSNPSLINQDRFYWWWGFDTINLTTFKLYKMLQYDFEESINEKA